MRPWKCNGRSLYYKYRGQVTQLTHVRRSEPDDLCGSEIKGDRKRGMFTMYEIGEICFGGYLCVVSMWDIRKREIPVSYTHLDVYKRQVVYTGRIAKSI